MTADELTVRQPARTTPVNVREIVEQYLKAHGFDGLACQTESCGCQIGDLAPCCDGDNVLACMPGYVHTCETCNSGRFLGEDPECSPIDEDPCPIDDHPQEGGWCISTEKPEVTL
jgi:hypothetical protein